MDNPRHALNNVLQTLPPPQGPDDPQRVQVVKGPSSNPAAQRALQATGDLRSALPRAALLLDSPAAELGR